MGIIRVIDKIMQSICKKISLVLSIIMISSVFLQVMSRVLFKISFGWTEELCRYAAVWMVMFMAALAVRESSHITLSMVKDALPHKAKVVLEKLGILIILIFSCYLVRYGFEYALSNLNHVSTGMRLPKGLAYLCIPLGSIISVFNAVICLFSIDKRLDAMETEVKE